MFCIVKPFISWTRLLVFYSIGTMASGGNLSLHNRYYHKQEHPSYLKDDYTCRQNQSFLWCIPLDYNKEVEPWRDGYISNTSFPWNYHFQFNILEIAEINDKMQTIVFSMYLLITWLEPRLQINESATGWVETIFGPPNEVWTSAEVLKHLWYPDLDVYGLEEFNQMATLKDCASMGITKDQTIEYSLHVDIRFSCQMNFDQYPLDSHQCPFRIGSYSNTVETINCTSEVTIDKERQRSLQHFISIEPLPRRYHTYLYHSRRFATCGFNVLLSRTRTQNFFQVYLTSLLFVIVSWVSFIIHPDVVPGRMGLLVVVFLVLINIFNGAKSAAPVSTNLNAVDLYLIICIVLVFAALVEYAIVLLRKRNQVEHNVTDVCRKKVAANQGSLTTQDANDCTLQAQHSTDHASNKVDKLSLIIFPIIFVLFNIIYWTVHF